MVALAVATYASCDHDPVPKSEQSAISSLYMLRPSLTHQHRTPENTAGKMVVELRVTARLAHAAQVVAGWQGLPDTLRPDVAKCIQQGGSGKVSATINHNSAVAIYKTLRNPASHTHKDSADQCPCRLRLHQLLQGTAIVEQPPSRFKPSAELLERREKLKAFIANKEYDSMTRKISKPNEDWGRTPLDVQDFKRQMSIAINLVVTMVACFFFGYFASQMYTEKIAIQVLFGLLSAIVAVGAEMYFLIRYSLEGDEKQQL
eukprot:m.352505 g.352505  ORF g.352505 m.352505 type:complete len:260 (+) comp19903_c4_seq1:2841-3620(+)